MKCCFLTANLIHVTKIDFSYEADTYFPNLDEMCRGGK